jgi:hypothetical protein
MLRSDGSRIELLEPPRARRGLLVGRLWPQGTLVSFPARDIDAAGTKRANEGGAPAPAPPAKQAPVEPSFAPPTLGARVKHIRPRADVERELAKSSGTARPEDEADDEAERPRRRVPRVPEVPDHVDLEGRGEDYWRARARALRADVNDARASLAAAEAEREAWERSWVPTGDVERSSWAWEIQMRRDAVDRARARLEAAERRLKEMEDEARKLDAYPGWLR